MNLLAFDASTDNLSLGMLYGGKVIVDHNEQARFCSSRLIARIDKYFKKFRLTLKDFDALVVGRGPGSFTGLRIAFSVAKGLSVSCGIPVITIGSFSAIAYGFKDRYERIAVIADARKSLAYTAAFAVKKGKMAVTQKERLCDLAGFVKDRRDHFFVTADDNFIEELKKSGAPVIFNPAPAFPAAKNLIALGRDLFYKGKLTPLDKLEPLYLHPQTCQIRTVCKRHS